MAKFFTRTKQSKRDRILLKDQSLLLFLQIAKHPKSSKLIKVLGMKIYTISYPRSLAKRRRSYLKLNSYFKSLSY